MMCCLRFIEEGGDDVSHSDIIIPWKKQIAGDYRFPFIDNIDEPDCCV